MNRDKERKYIEQPIASDAPACSNDRMWLVERNRASVEQVCVEGGRGDYAERLKRSFDSHFSLYLQSRWAYFLFPTDFGNNNGFFFDYIDGFAHGYFLHNFLEFYPFKGNIVTLILHARIASFLDVPRSITVLSRSLFACVFVIFEWHPTRMVLFSSKLDPSLLSANR